ncbi:MAG TPA: hypothetical protein VK602_16275 [Phyllobacterium sp.]|nr:hypothetical protein [Phyllobacterium sp.]
MSNKWEISEAFFRNLVGQDEFDSLESPIELMFLIALKYQLSQSTLSNNYCVTVTPQHCFDEINCRVDFYIFVEALSGPWDYFDYCVVECDGREFHHASWSQIERDRLRDQQIESIGHGCKVFRFPGTQIVNDPVGCTMAVIYYFLERAAEAAGRACTVGEAFA